MESQYCRSDTNREYLECNLSLSAMSELRKEMWAELYFLHPVWCVINSAKENIYQRVFTDEFHVNFHKPKENSCDICDGFRNLSNPTEDNRDK